MVWTRAAATRRLLPLASLRRSRGLAVRLFRILLAEISWASLFYLADNSQSSQFIREFYLRLLEADRGASAADDVVCRMPFCCGWSPGLSAALRLNSVNVAERSSSDRSMRRPSIWLTFHPLISSPICTRSIFAVPERTMARARSPSTTIPSRVTSGGAGGGSGARSTGGGGGAGGRRSDENSGRSRVADRRSSDSACKGLPRIAAGWSWDCAFAPVAKIEANPSTRTEMLGNDSECVTASPSAKKRASPAGRGVPRRLQAARRSCSALCERND
jgi:hypothetical protein